MQSLADQLPEPLLRVHDYWLNRQANGKLPGRQAVDPVELRDSLSSLCLIDVLDEPEGRRYRYRLIGTHVAERMGRDYTGEYFDEILAPERLEEIERIYSTCINSREPHFSTDTVPVTGRDFVSYKRLLLPLASDGERVDMILSVYEFSQWPLQYGYYTGISPSSPNGNDQY